MEGLRLSSGTALFCTISSLIVCSCGLFLKSWWLNVEDNDKTYGIFTVVNCEENLCKLNTETTEGWVVFIQAALLMQFMMLIVAIIFQTAGLIKKSLYMTIAASGALGWSCASSVLQMIVLSVKYLKLTFAYQTTTIQPVNYVTYQTLPMGLCLISGSLCIPAFVCLVIYRTEERRMKLKQSNMIV